MYIKTKSGHFDAMTITVVMLGKFVCTFFLREGEGHFWDKNQISSGEGKWKGKSGYGGEPKMRVNFAKFPLFSKI